MGCMAIESSRRGALDGGDSDVVSSDSSSGRLSPRIMESVVSSIPM